jgi:hypothetical protein
MRKLRGAEIIRMAFLETLRYLCVSAVHRAANTYRRDAENAEVALRRSFKNIV